MLEECLGDMSWKSVETKRLKPSLCAHVYVCVCVRGWGIRAGDQDQREVSS